MLVENHEDEQDYAATSKMKYLSFFLNFEPDFETKRTYEFVLIVRDYSQIGSFTS